MSSVLTLRLVRKTAFSVNVTPYFCGKLAKFKVFPSKSTSSTLPGAAPWAIRYWASMVSTLR